MNHPFFFQPKITSDDPFDTECPQATESPTLIAGFPLMNTVLEPETIVSAVW